MRALLTASARVLPPALFAKLHCLAKLRYWPNLDDPATFTERLLAKRAHERNPLLPLTADKFTLREYVSERIGAEYLPQIYHVALAIDEVELSGLPSDYVMKGSHGSGWNRIVEKGDLSLEEAQACARRWLGRSFYWKRQEWAYKPLTPRIIFEEHLAPGALLNDYKIFVFRGVPRMIQVDKDRFSGHKRSLFTPDWQSLNVECEYPPIREPLSPPKQLAKMLEVASILGQSFDFVRIDLYALADRIVVGEMTHYPEAGVVKFIPTSFDAELGAVWAENRPISERYL